MLAEEVLREKIRSELAASQKKSRGSRVLDFLNSPLGLFLLSSVLIAGLGTLYTDFQASRQRAQALQSELTELVTEMDYRTTQSEFLARDVEGIRNITEGNSCVYLWRVVVGDREFQPSMPRFKETHWLGLVSKVQTLTKLEEPAVEAAIVQLEMETDGGRCGGRIHLQRHIGTIRSYVTRLQSKLSQMDQGSG